MPPFMEMKLPVRPGPKKLRLGVGINPAEAIAFRPGVNMQGFELEISQEIGALAIGETQGSNAGAGSGLTTNETGNVGHGPARREAFEAAVHSGRTGRAGDGSPDKMSRVSTKFKALDADASKSLFDKHDAAVQELMGRFKEVIDHILAHLTEVQALLSQRGARRKMLDHAGLPTWDQYMRRYADAVGRDIRALYQYLRRYQGKSGPSLKKPKKRDTTTRNLTKAEKQQISALWTGRTPWPMPWSMVAIS
jgi:hypothetical protein